MGTDAMELIKVDDCFSPFPEEWVCLRIQEEEPGHVISGRLIAHKRDQDEVWRAAEAYRDVHGPVPTYVFFAGPLISPDADCVIAV